jgi:hypothetical protein
LIIRTALCVKGNPIPQKTGITKIPQNAKFLIFRFLPLTNNVVPANTLHYHNTHLAYTANLKFVLRYLKAFD